MISAFENYPHTPPQSPSGFPMISYREVCISGFAVLIFFCFVTFFMGFGKVNFECSCLQHDTLNCILYNINRTVSFYVFQ